VKIKHTFLFTMLLGLCWAGFLFAHSSGPDPGVNGIFGPANTCNQAMCHTGNPLNAAGGTLTLDGLPASWMPGTTYPLTITVQKSGAILYGFQLSAVFDSTTQQAGDLTKGKTSGTDASRISIITGGGVEYAQHNEINSQVVPTTTFYVNWTAPSTTSGGTVRFNLAGNAANGDRNNTGDFIYTRVDKVSPAAATPPDFSLTGSTGDITVAAGSGVAMTLTVTGANGFNNNVDLTISGVPANATANFDPASVGAGANSTLTITTTSDVVPGIYPLTITGTSGSLTHTVSVALTVAPAPGSPTQTFAIENLGSVSSQTDGTGDVNVGYVRIQPDSGMTTPSGVEIFGYRKNNILVSETGVPASPLLTAGRIYAEDNGIVVRTGVAIANPNSQTANINFFFTAENGTTSGMGVTQIGANQQLARYLDEGPYSGSANFQGTFSFTSDVPVSVIALRSLKNERGDDLISTLPVIDTSVAAATGTQVIPHFATGNGWTTQVILVNSSSVAMTGTVQFFNGLDGSPASVQIDGQVASSVAYNIPARAAKQFLASGAVAGGSVHVAPTGGGAAPVPLTVFSYKPDTITLTEAGAPANFGTAFRMYVESSDSGLIQSGIAVANTTNAPADVFFQLFKPDGTPAGLTVAKRTLPATGQVAAFLGEIFAPQVLPVPFKGVLRISSASAIAVTGLRGHYNERAQPDFLITTTPPTLESGAAVSTEMLFPHLVNGGGYTTQFILFSGTAGQSTSGMLRFFTLGGSALNLVLSN
jgi:hypothetical protein